MGVNRCPQCNIPLTQDEARSGSCPSCKGSIATAPSEGRGPAPVRQQREWSDYQPRPSADGHTAKCDARLPAEYRGRFPVLAQVMEKASILWAMFLSPLIWAFLNKHYVLGYQASSRTLFLFRQSLGLFGAGQAYEVLEYHLNEISDLDYRNYILTARLSFRTHEGRIISLFIPMPSRRNALAVFDSMGPRG
jgi:hypothetical protein